MRRTLTRGVVAAALVAAVVLPAAGCSAVDDTKACNTITQDISDVSSTGMSQTDDPDALAQTYRDGAKKIREDAADASDDVKSAADKAADAMESLADQVAARSTQQPDQQPLIDAGQDLKAACT